MLNIVMDDKTREYLLKKGGIINIVKTKQGNC